VSFATIQYLGDGTVEQSASHVEENLMMALPCDSVDLPALMLLHVPGGAEQLAPRCSPPPGGPR
jgi:hypothetical protein